MFFGIYTYSLFKFYCLIASRTFVCILFFFFEVCLLVLLLRQQQKNRHFLETSACLHSFHAFLKLQDLTAAVPRSVCQRRTYSTGSLFITPRYLIPWYPIKYQYYTSEYTSREGGYWLACARFCCFPHRDHEKYCCSCEHRVDGTFRTWTIQEAGDDDAVSEITFY
jgi:hypothetical protein